MPEYTIQLYQELISRRMLGCINYLINYDDTDRGEAFYSKRS